MLLKVCVDLTTEDSHGHTPLLQTFHRFVDYGFLNRLTKQERNKNMAFHCAQYKKMVERSPLSIETFKEFINNSANVNHQDIWSQTIFMLANC